MISGSGIRKRNTNFRWRDPCRVTYQNRLDPLKKDCSLARMASRHQIRHPGVTLQANFPWKITFDMLYTNEFVIRVHSRALSIPSERNTI